MLNGLSRNIRLLASENNWVYGNTAGQSLAKARSLEIKLM